MLANLTERYTVTYQSRYFDTNYNISEEKLNWYEAVSY